MSTTQDSDIGIWVCPHGYSADVIEYAIGGPEPNAAGCPTHGEEYIKRCTQADCPSPVYHPSDLDASYHTPCRATIPWAETRGAAARALMEHDPFNSKLLGTKKRDFGLEHLVRKRYFGGRSPGESTPAPRDLTPEERQDLITPPSERLPAESVRTPEPKEKAPPRITGFRGTGSKLSEPDLVPEDVDAPKPVRKSQQVWKPGPLPRVVGPKQPGWVRLWSGISGFLSQSFANALGTIIAAAVIVLLAVYCGVKLSQ
ncbi:MAG: hypothetical protein AABM40_14895 [Chloroflexota bacterium]